MMNSLKVILIAVTGLVVSLAYSQDLHVPLTRNIPSLGAPFDAGQDRGIVINTAPVGAQGSSGFTVGQDVGHNITLLWVHDANPDNGYGVLSAVQKIQIDGVDLQLQFNSLGDVSIGKFMAMQSVTFASLGAQSNGHVAYCSNCTIANPCASGGTGALAKRLNSTWVCN